MPEISVVMASYNSAPFLTEAVDSIRNQTFTDWELIVVNDGATDESPGMLDRFAAEDHRIRVFHQTNQGQQAAANLAIRQAQSPLIARMDADDVSEPERLEKQFRFLQSHPEIGLVGGQIQRMGNSRFGLPSNLPLEHDAIVSGLLKNHHTLCNATILFRREIFERTGGYWEHNIAEDWDMFLRMSEHAQIANLSDLVLKCRLHANSINGRRIVEAQMFNEFAAHLAVCRQQGKPESDFAAFKASHRSRYWPQSWLFYLDCQSIGQYREAVAEIYNGMAFRGYCRLGLAMLMSPTRAFRRIGNMISRRS